jgi:predicted nucleic acid-binding protein
LTVVLDAWAVVAYLRDEPSAARIAELVEREGAVASWINLGEVVYQEARRVGFDDAEAAVRALATTITAEQPDVEAIIAAARWKTRGGLSYADAFAAATAQRHDAPLLTGDPELIALDADGIEVVDLRG